MSYSTRPYATGYSSRGFANGVKWLLITNITLFVLYFLAVVAGVGGIFRPFELVPRQVLSGFAVWQLVTYMFLHDPTGFGHILFNMLSLYFFGGELERDWGTRNFLRYYFVCGIGAGVCVVLANLMVGTLDVRTIGASGAIYGLLFAFGYLYPNREIQIYFLFTIKAKYLVMIFGGMAFLGSLSGSTGGVSNIAHLGGMLVGFVLLRTQLARRRSYTRRSSWFSDLRERWKEYRMQRAKRKFQVYLRKQSESDKDRWVH
ncbi:MAG TPA: rhomboid family intramembrane serine protease [Bryobacteraceae bacterium]|nr:rhomboid family intramembrane serine protease [Bryobacteraceae bacterium]